MVGWFLGGLVGIIGFYGWWLTGESLWIPLLYHKLNGGMVNWLLAGWLVGWMVGGREGGFS